MTHNGRPAALDEARVGLSFIEVLFSLTVVRILEPLMHYTTIPNIGKTHLVLAFVLTVTSWVGYHNSWNRPRFFIRFANLPLWQFLIDVALVVTYWFCATSAEGIGTDLGHRASAQPESVAVAISFILYCLWDWVGYTIRKSDRYEQNPVSKDVPRRRYVTWAFATIAVGIALAVWVTQPKADRTIMVVDFILIFLIIAFRFTKEFSWVTRPDAYQTEIMETANTSQPAESTETTDGGGSGIVGLHNLGLVLVVASIPVTMVAATRSILRSLRQNQS